VSCLWPCGGTAGRKDSEKLSRASAVACFQVHNGVITQWEDMERVWRHAFSLLGVSAYRDHKATCA